MMTRTVLLVLACSFLYACKKATFISPEEMLSKSIAYHDPSGNWDKTALHLHIQEPRIKNTSRYSVVTIDNKLNSFELKRNRGDKTASYIMSADGDASTQLNGEAVTDTNSIKQYLLQPSRVGRYQDFYKQLLGLPMSIQPLIDSLGTSKKVLFNNKSCIKVPVKLTKGVFSNYWNLFFDPTTFEIVGIEIIYPDDPEKGERLYFDGAIKIDGLTLPRHRHWHEYKGDAYSGSDILIVPSTD